MAPATPRVGKGDVGASLARWSLAFVLIWIGGMRFTSDGAAMVTHAISGHRLLSPLVDFVPARLVATLIGVLQIGAGVLIAVGKRPGLRLRFGALLSIVLASVPLSLFFTNPVWIESMGGFPFIGSGQGLLKYVTILGVSLYLYSESADLESHESLHRPALNVMLVGLILALGWIGGMKFTAVEAQALQPLLETSPILSWMLSVFSLQGASNFIGTTEIVTVILLASWWVRPQLFIWGAALAFGTFVTTLSFILTLPGWHDELGFPALGGTGQFLIKDLLLLVAVLILLVEGPGDGRMGAPEMGGRTAEDRGAPPTTERPHERSAPPNDPPQPGEPNPT